MEFQEGSGRGRAKAKVPGETPYKKILNPLTNRYIKATGQVARQLVKDGVIKKTCGKGQMMNEKTNRCVNIPKVKRVYIPKDKKALLPKKKYAVELPKGFARFTV
jgi:hypothetical protein